MQRTPETRMKCLISLTLSLFFTSLPAFADGETPDRILLNGKIITVDAQDHIAEAVAIRGQHILAVGTNAEIEALAGPETERIDLKGLTATPGLLDAHLHFSQGGLMKLTTVDLSFPMVKKIADITALVADRRAAIAQDAWIIGRGWDEGKLEERRYLLASDVDPVSGNHPAWLVHTMGHYGTANSVALELAGIRRDTPDPPGGVIDRDENGEPTGVLKETAMDLVSRHIPRSGQEEKLESLRMMSRELNHECMTGLKDPGIGWGLGSDTDAAKNAWDTYRAVQAEGALTVRAFLLWPSPKTLDEARTLISDISAFPKPYESTGDDHLISGGIKVYADGSGGARTAWVWEDWNKDRTGIDEGNSGYPAIDADLIRQQIRLYHDAGLHVGVHAIGDRAIDWVVASYALALKQNPQQGLRHSIIHANIPTDKAMDTMAALQREYDAAYPEPSPTFTWWIGDTYAGNFGEERSHRLNPFRSFRDKGIQWAGGSDFFVTPFPARYGIWSAITREPLLGVYGKNAFGTDQAVDAGIALRAFTISAAHQMFLEDKIGSIEPGKYADIAIWDTDFYTAEPAAIKDAQCQMTLFNGEVVYRAD